MKWGLCLLVVFSGIAFFFFSCDQESFSSEMGDRLVPEIDTLTFDTVFATIGSATRYFKIFNPHAKSIQIERIFVSSGIHSDFRINVDGTAGPQVEKVDVGPGDSVYVFCEVTVNPFDPLEVSPFIKEDSIIIEYNGNKDHVHLIAWGQNANYIPSKTNKGQFAAIDLQGGTITWNDQKPYIIYGIVRIENGILEIDAGTQVHFWGGLTKAQNANGDIVFYNDGRLIVGATASLHIKGTIDKPVVLQGVRLESQYASTPGQWSGIFLDRGSAGNRLNYAIIKNNLIGLYADSSSSCIVENTRIFNNSIYGMYASSAQITIHNSLFYNQGSSSLFVTTGGETTCNYVTFVNLGNTDPSVYVSNAQCIDFPFCQQVYTYPLKAQFTNCIITGSDQDEFWFTKHEATSFDLNLQNCMFRSKELLVQFPEFNTKYTKESINYSNFQNLFRNIFQDDFHPDSLFVLQSKGKPISGIDRDLDGNIRDAVSPDIGCFEYVH